MSQTSHRPGESYGTALVAVVLVGLFLGLPLFLVANAPSDERAPKGASRDSGGTVFITPGQPGISFSPSLGGVGFDG